MKQYDIIVIGMGPAGMAVSAMGSAMGLKVLAIEQHKVGGECLNYGCIPSKALIKAGEARNIVKEIAKYGIKLEGKTTIEDPLNIVKDKVNQIAGPKTMKMFKEVEIILNKGMAKFVNKNIIEVDNKQYKGKKIFIATGTEPMIPPIEGLKDVDQLTNLNIFEQKSIPKTLTIIGGGAIGSEMAQAFSRLGTKIIIVHIDEHLIPTGDKEAGLVLQEKLSQEGVAVYNKTCITKVSQKEGIIFVETDKGTFESEKILVATGRKPRLSELKLENAKIKYTPKGISVDQYMRTNIKNIYAIGDCNGLALLSHAAMHQGMLALMNAINPISFLRMKRKNYLVPWSVFTKPEIAQVGLTEKEAKTKGLKYEVIVERYCDYGRTIADGQPEGFVKVITSPLGKIYGVTIAGEAASEMIHEWIIAMSKNIGLFTILMTQHSFPTISLLNKRIAEKWMMNKMESSKIRSIIKFMFRLSR